MFGTMAKQPSEMAIGSRTWKNKKIGVQQTPRFARGDLLQVAVKSF